MTKALLDLAIQAHQSGDADTAERYYAGILEKEPENHDALHLLGILYGQTQRWEKALKCLERVIKLDPDSPQIHNSLGNTLKNLNKPDKAIEHYKKAIALEPKMFTAHNNLAIIYSSLNRWEEAIHEYKKAIEIEPQYEDAHFNLAMTLMKTHDVDNALKHLEKTLEIKPDHAEALRQYAQIQQQRGKITNAIQHYKKSVEIDPTHVDTLINLGATLLSVGEHEEAVQFFERALEYDPNNFEAHYNLGSTYLSFRKLEDSLKHYLKALELNASKEIYYNIGVIYMYQERQSDAIGFLRYAIDLDPDYFEAHVNLAVCYLKIEDIEKAIKHYQIAHELKPNNKEITFILDALKQKGTSTKAPKEFVKSLFDQYAPYFEKHLTEYLEYESPKKIYGAVTNVIGSEKTGLVVLDLGCGTGLCGALFKHTAKKLIGVDISSEMIKQAKEKHIYDEVLTTDIHEALKLLKNNDIIIAGDVFTYIGDLENIFLLASEALNQNGIFAFTIEKQDQAIREDFHLQQSARFTHNIDYIHRLANQFGFTIEQEQEITLRTQKKKPLPGLLFVLSKSASPPPIMV